jgi:cell division protein FtsZ
MVKEGLINLDFADVRAVMREMGKAMMGTGEASGEKRALSAAEAAISNPLIDDSSMKGARGLLISITGGRDLTLYEVDEAATRIREEVDQEANIIVGATFDESLEGIIRVAVVATGIDQAASAGRPAASAPETRLAEIAHKLRVDQQRLTERLERVEAPPRPAAPPVAAPGSMSQGVESAARAAVAAAVLPITSIEDVTIRPMQPKPSLFPEPAAHEPLAAEPVLPRAFIPPAPDRPGNRPPRMPRIDELPMPAQNELRAQQGEGPAGEHPEKRRMSLLQRLATVGLGRREEADAPEAPINRAPARPAPRPDRPAERPNERPAERSMDRSADRMPPRPAPRPPESRGPDPVSDYARRPTHQGLDPHGRQGPVHNSPEEDHLDIPAFLRRQAT